MKSVRPFVRRRSQSIDEHVQLTARDGLVHCARKMTERTAETHEDEPDISDIDVRSESPLGMRARDDGAQ